MFSPTGYYAHVTFLTGTKAEDGSTVYNKRRREVYPVLDHQDGDGYGRIILGNGMLTSIESYGKHLGRLFADVKIEVNTTPGEE